jgi:hypothetical protein
VLLLVLLALLQMMVQIRGCGCDVHSLQSILRPPSPRPQSRGLGAVASSSTGDDEGGWGGERALGPGHHAWSTHSQALQMPAAISLVKEAPVQGLL